MIPIVLKNTKKNFRPQGISKKSMGGRSYYQCRCLEWVYIDTMISGILCPAKDGIEKRITRLVHDSACKIGQKDLYLGVYKQPFPQVSMKVVRP